MTTNNRVGPSIPSGTRPMRRRRVDVAVIARVVLAAAAVIALALILWGPR